jgi:hypothetical protein
MRLVAGWGAPTTRISKRATPREPEKRLLQGHAQLIYHLTNGEELTITQATLDARNQHNLARGAIASRFLRGERDPSTLWRPRYVHKVSQ